MRDLLFETAGLVPARFDIVNGQGETLVVEARDGSALRVRRARGGRDARRARGAHGAARAFELPALPVLRALLGHGERDGRIELLPEVQIAHVPEYHALGVRTLADLVALDPECLPAGPVRGAAKHAIVVASAWIEKRAAWLQPPLLPTGPLVWFDLEGDFARREGGEPDLPLGLALELPGEAPVAEAIVAEMAPTATAGVGAVRRGGRARFSTRIPARASCTGTRSSRCGIERYALRLARPTDS